MTWAVMDADVIDNPYSLFWYICKGFCVFNVKVCEFFKSSLKQKTKVKRFFQIYQINRQIVFIDFISYRYVNIAISMQSLCLVLCIYSINATSFMDMIKK